MKVEAECGVCLLQRGYSEIKKATSDPFLQLKALSSLFQLLAKDFKPTAVPAHIGTKRDRLIKKITGNPDPYNNVKKMSNRKALEILPLAKSLVSQENSKEARFRKACLSAIVGNVIEFDIPSHAFKFEDIGNLIQQAEQELVVGHKTKVTNTKASLRTI